MMYPEIAEACGTPCYVYSAEEIAKRFDAYDRTFGDLPHQICYAVKANSNLSILRLLAAKGAGFDIVSGGELYRVLQAGGDPGKVVFSGVGKTEAEIDYALDKKIHAFNCESLPEIERINEAAKRRRLKPRIAIRVNPDVDASTHPYISTGLSEHKFGIDLSEVGAVYAAAHALPHISVEGVSCHIGSQILDPDPLLEAVDKVLALARRLQSAGIPIQHLDLGGGLGVQYKPSEEAPEIPTVVQEIKRRVSGSNLHVTVEPGRSIVGEAGVLLTRVLYRKRSSRKEFVIVDAAMNDLIRPALYKSYHDIQPIGDQNGRPIITADIVGPVCETGDFLARARDIPDVEAGELLVIRTAGAYGFVQASNYNSRPRPAEVLIENGGWRIIRQRESYEDLVRGE
ncbi:MAG TPA: diaminopimelate decarboxylase [Bryobacteraceae bacterium]|nr:diaminopimelate decarboxylase [Bryobacteraceae bacterium]